MTDIIVSFGGHSMLMGNWIITFFVLLLLILLEIIDKKLSYWIFKEKRAKLSETDGEKTDKWVRIILSLIGITGYFFIAKLSGSVESIAVMSFWLFIIILINSFQSYLEWKYIKQTKQFVIPLILMVIGIVGVTSIYFVNDQLKYTTFQEVVSKQLNEDTIVRMIKIDIHDPSKEWRARTAWTTIEDEKIIEQILDDFSKIELIKRDIDYRIEQNVKYRVRIILTNQAGYKHSSTETLIVSLDEDHLISDNYYEIINTTDHLNTIESLIDSDEIEWKYSEE